MRRVLVLLLAAGAAAAVAVPATAGPDPVCKVWWTEKPSVEVHPGSQYPVVVSPGNRPQIVC